MTRSDRTPPTRGIEVLDALREMILDGEFPAGSHLNEVELAESLGVSRTPVRAALTALKTEDLVTYTPNSGYKARTYTKRDVENVLEVKAVLEGLASRQAAELGLSSETQEKIRAVLDATEKLLGVETWSNAVCDQWVEQNHTFHGLIVEASGNERLKAMLDKTQGPFLHQLRYQWFTRGVVGDAHKEHLEIFEVLLRRNATRAELVCREHIYRAATPLIEGWGEFETNTAKTRKLMKKTVKEFVLRALKKSE